MHRPVETTEIDLSRFLERQRREIMARVDELEARRRERPALWGLAAALLLATSLAFYGVTRPPERVAATGSDWLFSWPAPADAGLGTADPLAVYGPWDDAGAPLTAADLDAETPLLDALDLIFDAPAAPLDGDPLS